jgi:sarcosine oxidase subunit gamma
MLEAFEPALPAHPMLHRLPARPMFSIAVFHGREAALNEALGVTLPVTPRQAGGFLWAGPGAWLALHPPPDLSGIAAVTAQGDGLCGIAVTGADARAALAKLLPIDLHEDAFPPDAVAITLAGHIGVRVWRDGDAFVLACFRSFAGALYEALVLACQEFSGMPRS